MSQQCSNSCYNLTAFRKELRYEFLSEMNITSDILILKLECLMIKVICQELHLINIWIKSKYLIRSKSLYTRKKIILCSNFWKLFSIVAVMFNFPDPATVKKVVNYLPRVGVGTCFGLPQTRYCFMWEKCGK